MNERHRRTWVLKPDYPEAGTFCRECGRKKPSGRRLRAMSFAMASPMNLWTTMSAMHLTG